ncbi:MAG: polya polymerase [Desulfobulbaceae bacterium]|nr:MAG: polya polymerase [Desulfobulbaceae bacterium]
MRLLLPIPTMNATPNIIEPSEHPIRTDMIDDEALHVMRKLNRAGFSSYLVGGGVRDLYLGKTPKDFDIGTDARPGQIRRLFNNSRTIGRRFRLVQVFFKNRKTIEVSTLRSLSEHDIDGPEAVLAPNNTYGTPDEDALRRDLTINALFYEIQNRTIIDYVGGVNDLDRGIIRIIGAADRRITNDPVRMMRAVRHSVRNHFMVEEESWAAICRNHHLLRLCPPSRLRDETLNDIYSSVAAEWFELSLDGNLFTELFPIYQEQLATKMHDGASCRDHLARIFLTIDRVNRQAVASGNHRQPDYFFLAFLLIPWAEISFNLVELKLKGPQLYQLAKHIRETVNQTIGIDFNLRRSTRQEITTLLAHLPLLHLNQNENSWPKWLKRKSYFKKCRLLYLFYREAIEGVEAEDYNYPVDESSEKHKRQRSKRSKKSRRQGRPAFSGSKRGGVFGFKR